MTIAELPAVHSETFDRLYELLTAANSKFNLTRIESKESFLIKHVIDSMALLEHFPELAGRSLSVADVGCGAGFPSLVLAILCPQWRICAIDSIAKKTNFVRSAAGELALGNLEVVTGRACELNRQKSFQYRFDLVTARAVGPAAKLASETSRFLKPGGKYIFYKTPHTLDEEIGALKQKFPRIKWHSGDIYDLPEDAGSRIFIYS
jgi:16S rRNA (guanine527-N7)-methyltransferase